ncbi:hypothetical protein FCR2A7T_24590 [Flavobacterium cauense R2A-7]|nr:hypothetical protein FCR2A7T_24590 [Flavobacterium cauense R2A-7]
MYKFRFLLQNNNHRFFVLLTQEATHNPLLRKQHKKTDYFFNRFF